MKIIDIVVSPAGETRIETRGFTGSECRKASEFVERALGDRIAERLTSEFHQTNSVQQRQQEHT